MAYIDKIMGCLYGGAIGDALGYPVEFFRKGEIFRKYGQDGIQDYDLSGGKALMSDDTQMTLFTLAGLLAWQGDKERKAHKDSWKEYVWKSYQDWFFTQDKRRCPNPPRVSWLADEPVMQARRAPGLTCMSSMEGGICGSISQPLNDSKGCGGLMRIAPAAFWLSWEYSCETSLAGAEMAAMTHGHPLSMICAAAFVGMLERLLEGRSLPEAVESGLDCADVHFRDWEALKAFKRIMDKAVSLSKSDVTDLEAIEALGEGWVAEEALAIAVYCSLKHEGDFAAAVAAAVNHSGDSDSTGAVTGNIMGAAWGYSKLPQRLLKPLEAKEVLDRLASSLAGKMGRKSVWERVRSGRWFTGYSTKCAMRFKAAFVIEGSERGGCFEHPLSFEYLLLYQKKEDGGACLKVRLGPRRFIQLRKVEEGSLEVALYRKRKGEEPEYRLETPLIEKKGDFLSFDAEKYLKDSGIGCRPADKQDYDHYAFEFRGYTNSSDNKLSRAYASKGGLFYWTYAWLDCSVDEVVSFYANRQSDGEGKAYYARMRTWGGLEEAQLDDERQLEAEMDILERIGLEK